MTYVDWTDVVVKVIWLVLVGILIPVIKSAAQKYAPIVISYFKSKTNSNLWNIILDSLEAMITSAEVNILGEKKGAERKAYILDQLEKQNLINDSNRQMVSDLIDGICVRLTDEGIINTEKWKEWLDSQKSK